jgi:hypothetical protein
MRHGPTVGTLFVPLTRDRHALALSNAAAPCLRPHAVDLHRWLVISSLPLGRAYSPFQTSFTRFVLLLIGCLNVFQVREEGILPYKIGNT